MCEPLNSQERAQLCNTISNMVAGLCWSEEHYDNVEGAIRRRVDTILAARRTEQATAALTAAADGGRGEHG